MFLMAVFGIGTVFRTGVLCTAQFTIARKTVSVTEVRGEVPAVKGFRVATTTADFGFSGFVGHVHILLDKLRQILLRQSMT